MARPEDLIGRPVSRLQEISQAYARERVATLTEDEVVDALRVQGIESLDALVAKALEAARGGLGMGGGQVAKDTFLFTQFVYRTEGPGLPQEVMEEVATRISRGR
jgi:hypothetical protein